MQPCLEVCRRVERGSAVHEKGHVLLAQLSRQRRELPLQPRDRPLVGDVEQRGTLHIL